MSAITWEDDVLPIAPELVDVPTDAQTIILAYVNTALNPSMFTVPSLRLARIYLAAHIGTNALPSAGGEVMGAVTSESVGDITRTYGAITAATNGSGFDTTSYGTLFTFLVRTSKARLPRVI